MTEEANAVVSPSGAAASTTLGATRPTFDAGLARACPDTAHLSRDGYRSSRKRIKLYERLCGHRGQEIAVEGAFLLLTQLMNTHPEISEDIDLQRVETSVEPFGVMSCMR